MTTTEAVLAKSNTASPATSRFLPIAFIGVGANRITVTAENFLENSSSHETLQISDINGADLATFGCRDGEFVIDSRDKHKRDESGDYCLLARFSLVDVALTSTDDKTGARTYSAVMTRALAYDSYLHNPILETRGGYSYLPPKHRVLSKLAPIQVTVVVSRRV